MGKGNNQAKSSSKKRSKFLQTEIVLVTILMLQEDTMIKATYKRRHLIGVLLIVSEG